MSTDTRTERELRVGEYYWCRNPENVLDDSLTHIVKVSEILSPEPFSPSGCVKGLRCNGKTGDLGFGHVVHVCHIDLTREVTQGDLEEVAIKVREVRTQQIETMKQKLEDELAGFLQTSSEE